MLLHLFLAWTFTKVTHKELFLRQEKQLKRDRSSTFIVQTCQIEKKSCVKTSLNLHLAISVIPFNAAWNLNTIATRLRSGAIRQFNKFTLDLEFYLVSFLKTFFGNWNCDRNACFRFIYWVDVWVFFASRKWKQKNKNRSEEKLWKQTPANQRDAFAPAGHGRVWMCLSVWKHEKERKCSWSVSHVCVGRFLCWARAYNKLLTVVQFQRNCFFLCSHRLLFHSISSPHTIIFLI